MNEPRNNDKRDERYDQPEDAKHDGRQESSFENVKSESITMDKSLKIRHVKKATL